MSSHRHALSMTDHSTVSRIIYNDRNVAGYRMSHCKLWSCVEVRRDETALESFLPQRMLLLLLAHWQLGSVRRELCLWTVDDCMPGECKNRLQGLPAAFIYHAVRWAACAKRNIGTEGDAKSSGNG